VEKYLKKQLEKCGVSYFDFYLVHCLNVANYKKVKKYKIFEGLLKCKEKGLIRHIGFSFHDKPPLLREIADDYPWEFAQIQLNYLDWELQDAKKQYEILKEKGIPIIVMEPVRGGKLATLCPESAPILKEADKDASLASWALRYCGAFPEVFTVLSGMSTIEQVEDNLETFTDFKPLTENERKTLQKALAVYKKIDSVFCTDCKYCECPFGIEIPKIFAVYNRMSEGATKEEFLKAYGEIDEKNRADKCQKCNKCASRCPQQIKIAEVLKKIAAEAKG
jgi:predicted aldo/keto reductase-like oxidoreductase